MRLLALLLFATTLLVVSATFNEEETLPKEEDISDADLQSLLAYYDANDASGPQTETKCSSRFLFLGSVLNLTNHFHSQLLLLSFLLVSGFVHIHFVVEIVVREAVSIVPSFWVSKAFWVSKDWIISFLAVIQNPSAIFAIEFGCMIV